LTLSSGERRLAHDGHTAPADARGREGAAPAKRNLADADFWYAAEAQLLAPMLYAAALKGRTMADVVTWIDTQDEGTVLDILSGAGSDPASNASQASMTRDDR
jgi:hypothetical protein